MKSNIAKVYGFFKLEHRDESGALLFAMEKPNLILNSGVTYFAARNAGSTLAAISHMALGTGAVAAAVGNTALGAEVGRVTASNGLSTTTITNDTVTYTASFGPGVATGAITEAGLVNAASAGTMVSRLVFATINKAATDTISVTWSLQSH
jgi:hypothetical protein